MKGYKLNSDLEYVTGIIKGISKKGGHCPCRLDASESTLCPCDEFISDGACKCNLFIKEDEED